MSDYDFSFKVILLGSADAGKPKIINSFANDIPDGFFSTVGVDSTSKTIKVDGERVKLQIWDTCNQDRYSPVTSSYYRSSNGIIVVYNSSIRSTFEDVHYWMDDIGHYASADVCCFLVSHKFSVDRQNNPGVSAEEGHALAQRYGIPFKEVCCNPKKNIDELFIELSREMIRKSTHSSTSSSPPPPSSSSSPPPPPNDKTSFEKKIEEKFHSRFHLFKKK